jgi:hypothetical protein
MPILYRPLFLHIYVWKYLSYIYESTLLWRETHAVSIGSSDMAVPNLSFSWLSGGKVAFQILMAGVMKFGNIVLNTKGARVRDVNTGINIQL